MKIRLIVGLGNPGSAYRMTYHNVGALAVAWLREHRALPRRIRLATTEVFMNESGKAVLKFLKTRRIHPHELLILHDDSDLPLGSLKLSFNRGAAGHRGVLSVIETLDTKAFSRIRIGIRQEEFPVKGRREKAGSFVLRAIPEFHRKRFEECFARIPELIVKADATTNGEAPSRGMSR